MNFRVRQPGDWDNIRQYIDRLPNKPYDVSITLHRERRSVSQNSLYWAWLGLISSETGHTSNELHDAFRQMFLPIKESRVFGRYVQELPSTTSLDAKQFTSYLNSIDTYCSSELGIVLPHPEDVFWNDFFEKYGQP